MLAMFDSSCPSPDLIRGLSRTFARQIMIRIKGVDGQGEPDKPAMTRREWRPLRRLILMYM
jgi:hypothetical protein